MFSLSLIFFLIPLYFSHAFAPIGLIIGESYSFERQKVYLFVILVVCGFVEMLIRDRKKLLRSLASSWHIGIVLVTLPLIASIVFPSVSPFLGSYEKHHGYIFFVSVLGASLLISIASQKDLQKFLRLSLASAVLVALVGLGEAMGGTFDIFRHQSPLSPYAPRIISTLGNPNYVAGYLLPFIPILITKLRKPILGTRSIFIIVFLSLLVLGILFTKSLIGISLLIIIGLWYGTRFIFSKKTQVLAFSVLVASLLIVGFFLIGGEKWLSLESRFVLQFEGLKLLIQYPMAILTGFGADSLWYLFFTHRTVLLDAYFPPDALIDSTHNVWLDILLQYGIIIFGLLAYTILHTKKQNLSYLPSLVALALFFSLNVAVVAHILICILFFALYVRDTQG